MVGRVDSEAEIQKNHPSHLLWDLENRGFCEMARAAAGPAYLPRVQAADLSRGTDMIFWAI